MNETRTSGLVLLCDRAGVIQKIMCDDFSVPGTLAEGQTLADWVDPASREKIRYLIAEVSARGSAFDWEINVPIRDKMQTLHFSSLATADGVLMVAARNHNGMLQLYEELMRINNDQVNALRLAIKDQTVMTLAQSQHDDSLYNEMSRLNNELVTVQRELTRKNYELERAQQLLRAAKLELEHALAREQHLARTDPLTGVGNRLRFFEFAEREFNIAARYHHPLSILMCDIDHFKKFNDTFGHTLGDRVLTLFAQTTQANLRAPDLLARFGGEEFIALLPATDAAHAITVAERIREHIAALNVETETGNTHITVSIGIAEIIPEDTVIDQIIHRADEALYAAKQAGRNCVVKFTDRSKPDV